LGLKTGYRLPPAYRMPITITVMLMMGLYQN